MFCKCWDNNRCMGTKEMDVCQCNGHLRRCDFYPEVRKKAQKDLMSCMPKGNINRRTLVKKLFEVSEKNNTELPQWVYNIIAGMHKED